MPYRRDQGQGRHHRYLAGRHRRAGLSSSSACPEEFDADAPTMAGQARAGAWKTSKRGSKRWAQAIADLSPPDRFRAPI